MDIIYIEKTSKAYTSTSDSMPQISLFYYNLKEVQSSTELLNSLNSILNSL